MTAISRFFTMCVLCVGVLMLSGCSETEFASHWAKKVNWPGQEEAAGTYKIGKPYRAGSVWYYPQEDFKLVETGIASWYGPDFHGKRTANGELYDQHELTAAHRTLQMPSLVRVTNLENGRAVVVRINDRGPFKSGRIIDCSKRAAELLGFIGKGTARVRLEVLSKESRQMAEAAKRGMDTSRLTMADLEKFDTPATVQNASYETHGDVATEKGRPQYAALDTTQPDALPESLQTPTITVEQLSAPASTQTQQPVYTAPVASANAGSARDKFVGSLNLDDEQGAPPASTASTPSGMASGHLEQGRFLPDPVVTRQPVAPTGIFVQAGAFGVRDNADRLKSKLSGIAPVMIDTVNTSGKTLYRVKLGPIASVDEADKVLDRVIRAGNGTARVVHDR
ncbi:MAG: septal ring lytic transglycosylase RlpA family protein [Micavibrio sp.]|nr:septal ring lytic transglycosylase RlpA family protein [Micavibrio sp.]